jgi:hypothetical protein
MCRTVPLPSLRLETRTSPADDDALDLGASGNAAISCVAARTRVAKCPFPVPIQMSKSYWGNDIQLVSSKCTQLSRPRLKRRVAVVWLDEFGFSSVRRARIRFRSWLGGAGHTTVAWHRRL